MKNRGLPEKLLIGTFAVASMLNPFQTFSQEKIDLQLDTLKESKLPVLQKLNIGDFNIQFFMPKISYYTSSDKASFLLETGYIQKDSENGIGINSRLEINPFEFICAGYMTLSGAGISRYGFDFGLGFNINSRAKINNFSPA